MIFMYRHLITAVLNLFMIAVLLPLSSYAQQSGGGNYPAGSGVRVKEVDGSPNVPGTQTLVFPNGSLTRAGQTVTVTFSGSSSFSTPVIVTSTSNPCMAVGPNGSTNPTFAVDCSVASEATGVKVTGAAAGSGITLGVTSSGSNENLILAPKGTGSVLVTISSGSGIREQILKGTVSDAGNNALYLGNATSTDAALVAMAAGYQVDADKAGFQFRAMTSAASDASDSSTFGLLDLAAFRTDSASDPNNGTLSSIVNRKLLSVRGGTASGDIRFSVRATGVLGNDNGVAFANLGTAANTFAICTDCQVTSGADNTCTSGGNGALAVRLNGVWRCFATQN